MSSPGEHPASRPPAGASGETEPTGQPAGASGKTELTAPSADDAGEPDTTAASTDDAGENEAPGQPAGTASPASRLTLLIGLVATVAVIGVAAFLAVDRGGEDPPPEIAGEPGQVTLEERVASDEQTPLPAFELEAFGDEPEAVRSDDYEGEPLVLNFWATWCPPCVEEMPALQEVAEDVDGLAMLGVNIQDDLEQARSLVDELGVTYDLAVDADAELFAELEGFGMPTTLFVDTEGVVQFRHTGPLDAKQLRELIGDHLGIS